MSEYVIRDGDFTFRITDDLDRWIEDEYVRMSVAFTESAREVLEPIRDDALRRWYGPDGVTRITGRSGDIQIVTTLDVGTQEVRVAIGSTDTRMVKGRDGRSRPRATAIHRPGALAMEWVEVTDAEYWRLWRENDKLGRTITPVKHDKKTGRRYAKKLKPTHSDGAYLLPMFVTGPARKAVKELNRAIGRRIALTDAGGA